MELLIFGGIALFSAGVGAGYYTCYYKPLSEAEERNVKQTPSMLIEESSSVESIVNNGKITERDYFHKLGRASGNRNSSELLMDGIIINNNNHDDIENEGVSNTMEGYEELPEHAISLVLQKTGKQVTSHTSAVRFDKNPLNNHSSNKGSSPVSSNQVVSENLDGDIDLDKFLRKEQEMKDKAFEESIKEKHPYGF
ncbi:hypothetical protein FDP41_007810 [Naegleria fowleri]|uniref:Uncharacterized protein n=1 Tax=Naegleria fowleri TaxID=5763 RepID=A0A6A5CF39_NAEFO|nr:uncharacterized protein FDP41_007810 [Naegleria fowleri]KAF0983895.1 hypothetical protein FDP41_007810 [Naegleria fowleri]CAG4715826.1 unnamed protein product [Naegleria fowleri]